MSNIANCRAMELKCRQRAKADPERGWKWLGQADRWHELGKQESAWRFQRSSTQQQMHAGRCRWDQTPSTAIFAPSNRGTAIR
jgi:hypothetical protein